jgi:hypothetical protein
MPKNTPLKVEPTALPAVPSWDILKNDLGFRDWHSSPYLRMMCAALRTAHPILASVDPHAMIRDGGIITGYLGALRNVDNFLATEEEAKEKTQAPPYSGATTDY